MVVHERRLSQLAMYVSWRYVVVEGIVLRVRKRRKVMF